MPTEVEARFAAADRSTLARLAQAPTLGVARLGPPAVNDEVDRYLDTPGARLARARWACRLRSRGDVTRISLKGPPVVEGATADGDWLHRRPELEGPADLEGDPGGWPPSEARDRLRDLTGGEPIGEVLRLVQRRTERAVDLGRRTVGTLSLDEVRVERRGMSGGEFLVVELELADEADSAALTDLAAELASDRGLVPESRTKLERATAMLAAAG